jgi:tRNA/rRNA methyltransferase
MLFSNISFILHKPQLSENVGACARALKNFNFKKLVIIDPKPIFPNDKIIATSVGAKDIIKNSRVYETLEPAIKKVDFVIATTSRFRNKNIKHIKLKDLKKIDFNKKVYKLTHKFVNQPFLGKLANTLDKIRVSF